MTKDTFLKLVERVRNGSASDQDIYLYHTWFSKFQSASEWNDVEMGSAEEIKNLIKQGIDEKIDTLTTSKTIRPLWTRMVAAASILLFVSLGAYYFLHQQQVDQAANYKNDVAPGHNQAVLTLASGQKIILTKGLYTKLAQGGTAIKINNGITYTAGGSKASASKEVAYNTLSTGIGEQSPFPLVLPDGSKVWLNALSSITFPTEFNGKERVVKVTGEVMFEVVHNAEHPFKVKTDKQIIEDIGTVFNVNAYTDEPSAQTTLMEGIVKVNDKLLKPGQQSDGNHIKAVNTRRYSAWRSGDFYFEDDNIQTVMRQLSRWYNVEVVYEGGITTEGFTARISRSKNISVILHILENTKGVHFKVEGRRVTVIE